MRGCLLLMVIAMVLAVTACSSGSTSSKPPSEQLAAAKKNLDEAKYIGFTLTGTDLPDGVPVLKSATGTGTHQPAFTGTVKVDTGVTFTAPVRAVGGTIYAKLPFAGWSTIDPQEYGAPDPAKLMSRTVGISALLTKTSHPHKEGSTRHGEEVLTTISGSLPGKAVDALFPMAGTGDFSVTYALTDDGDIQQVTMTGPFYDGHGDVTYTIDLDLAADPVQITAPQ